MSHAIDADRWITVKPNGPDHTGAHIKLDESGRIVSSSSCSAAPSRVAAFLFAR